MEAFTGSFNGTIGTVYVLKAREKVARHRHSVEHSMTVGKGSVTVDFWGDDRAWSEPGRYGQTAILPANIDHEITAGDDGAIILNMIAAGTQTYDVLAGQDGGVTLVEL